MEPEYNSEKMYRWERRKHGWDGPIAGIIFGLMVVWLGACLFLKQTGKIPADTWWAYLLVGFGGLWVLGGIVRLFVPRWRRGFLGGMIPGIVVAAVGLMFIYNSWNHWPLILVAVGVLVVISVVIQALIRGKRTEDHNT